jgi:soluble lytic murein transglycosylase-like protein
MARIASVLAFGVALSSSALVAQADLYGYVDEFGRTHISDQKLNERYQLFKRLDAPNSSKPTAAARAATDLADQTDQLPKINSAERKKYLPLVKRVAQRYNVEAALIHAVISAESAYDPRAVSPRGATGLMQLMPDTAGQYGVSNIYDPRENVVAGTKHLRYLMKVFDNDIELALAAYNAGHNTVLKYGRAIPPFPETRTYVPRVLGYYRKYRAEI